ncbi:MAG: hypothetical protein P8R42_06950 [Candidatus Binatia bacterium]|nr:hypothetical protein [Candidatus Binatia bacterium]
MEFGVLIHGYMPKNPHDAGAEHDWVEREIVPAADRCGFKYVWSTEHHFLEEYSHLWARTPRTAARGVVRGRFADQEERCLSRSPTSHPRTISRQTCDGSETRS